ncbi:MAG: COX15/CtaA family protein [Nitrospinae bacterium]|nr:COX15/CtaA family protein [Nitrospinota bacterium]
MDRSKDFKVAIWLLSVCGLIFCMVILGGVTRLTHSGLSMVQWQPLKGILPPFNQQDWIELFDLYKKFPEFNELNKNMDVEGFKSIFWLEYLHRILGRVIGLAFFIPFLFFSLRGYIKKSMRSKYVVMFLLGGLQGLLGWYMVKSGLVNDSGVSQYRLTAHLFSAFLIYAYILWTALGLLYPEEENKNAPSSLRLFTLFVAVYLSITIMSGGLVAGLKAGLHYNTFPLMNGELIPEYILDMSPIYLNFFENITTVQFDHRILAESTLLIIITLWYYSRKFTLSDRARLGYNLMLAMVFLQFSMGLATLLLAVPVTIASAHQGGALILFTLTLFTLHQMRGRN